MNPRRSNSTLPKPGRSAYGVATAVVLLLIPVVVLLGGDWLQQFLNFGAGVLSLVCLTCSVIWGLVAQDRLILNIRQRIVAQAIHRVTAVASIAFVLVHIGVKLALDHAGWISALIPFGGVFTGSDGADPGSATLIGMGSLAAYLMIFVGITGALRNQFASPAPVAARWRAMHMLAYPAWCAALIHGLYAGRAAKTFFMVSYDLCLVGVAAALALRAAPRPFKRRLSDRLVEILGNEGPSGLDDLEASRARMAESSLPGYDNARVERPSRTDSTGSLPRIPSPSGPLYDTPAPAAAPEPANGFAAAYRAVSTPGRGRQPFPADQTSRMNMPFDLQATEAIPRMDGNGSTSGSWPIPSPPPVGEAPPSAYDPLNDTGYNIPTYNNPGNPGNGYGGRDVYDTGETNPLYGTYNSNDTYTSGPATETPPGASFDAPGSGEPWNTPSGGYR
ncbi:ferric reductase-like transmembrane domain-containing protein [Streptomyces sp. Li-HN-5-11]|uniref:ferric reductase-like transmembrane domain-containing protein n=1 Tax=Streptomyces sp. Li-HN-5-11 TaxID=3075432 RepID=UPI0028AF43D1|nr:ferric reductase-like transmembrane domain-containing protein [Streptomyces sp. Li-HN-5-11]WNM35070.1 ferric reductase-like transmembrane domain-containing protein [Streptomyces sp. Li-HN-5-11]